MVTSVRKEQRGEQAILWTYGDMGRVHSSYSPFAEGLFRTGRGIEESTPVTQGAQWIKAASRDTSSDVIGKCSNQGSRRVSTLHHSPQEPRPQPAVVLGS